MTYTVRSDYETEFTINVTATVTVSARTTVAARVRAVEKLPEEFTATNARLVSRNWRPVAEKLLDSGMSQSEVARSLNLSRKTVSKAFPGRGWTNKDVHEATRLTNEIKRVYKERGLTYDF